MSISKAFECVPVLESLQNETSGSKIDCMECCGKELYLGTSDSSIVSFTLVEKPQEDGNVVYNCTKVNQTFIEQKKSIKCMKALTAINRLLVLCESNLLFLNLPDFEVIGGGPKKREVFTFCVNPNPNVITFPSVQICVAQMKRRLQIFNIVEDKLVHVNDVNLPERAQEIAMTGQHICAALMTQYNIYNFETNYCQPLFTYVYDSFCPVICSISQDEFLVSASEDLGMFVTTAGMSNRPPIQWSSPPISLAYYHPYILGLSDEVIMIYSILDQQQKQVIPYVGGHAIGNFDGRIYVCAGSTVYNLNPISWEKQVEVLLLDSRASEALQLAQNSSTAGMTKEVFQMKLKKIQQRAGFIYFANGEFEKAHEMLETGNVDVREVIALFPGYLQLSSSFVRAVPALHGIANVVQLFHGDEQKLKEAKIFLLQFLKALRESYANHTSEIDTALLKLYSELNPAELEPFIVAGEITCDIRDCCLWLESHGCYHALALLHRQAQDHDSALNVWSKIITGEYKDEHFQGLSFFVECLANLKEFELVWRYADFVLSRNEEIGVRIFMSHSDNIMNAESMKPDVIVDFLYRYPKAVVMYLEYLVLNRNIQIEKFHTHLAVLYLENISKLKKEGNDSAAADLRQKLQTLLQTSNLCRSQLLLGKMQGGNYHQECAILYGKREEHGKALDILVNELKDFKAAEMYCVNNTMGRELKYRHNVFNTLLQIYLDPKLESPMKEEFAIPAIDLLTARAADFDAVKVIKILPSSWSISVIDKFIRASLRISLHKFRMSKVESALARVENLQKKFALYDTERNCTLLQDMSNCCVCKKPLSDGTFARYPNNVITHVLCARQHSVCPMTGRNFGVIQDVYSCR